MEVETVIKTGRQIVQKQQTEQPKELDDRLTALKLAYNDLGSQVRECKAMCKTCAVLVWHSYSLCIVTGRLFTMPFKSLGSARVFFIY